MNITPSSCIIFDNGGDTLKFGIASESNPKLIKNCIGSFKNQPRKYVADEIDSLRNTSNLLLTRPFEKGIITNWHCTVDIWNRAFDLIASNINYKEKCFITTTAPFSPESTLNDLNEIVFEEYEFASFIQRPAAWFSAYEYIYDESISINRTSSLAEKRCSLVLDSGFSFTHSIPFINMKTRISTCRRLNVGGKVLTNYLKELVSYRQWNMMDEYLLVNDVKMDLCYVSTDAVSELKKSKQRASDTVLDPFGRSLRQFYVLPDFQTVFRGHVKAEGDVCSSNEQLLVMDSERFCVPEVLFRPSDISFEQAGVSECVADSIQALWPVERELSSSRVLLTGGGVLLPGFQDRLDREVRQRVAEGDSYESFIPADPITYSWRGAARYVRSSLQDGTLFRDLVSREEYLERGSDYCNKKNASAWLIPEE